MSPKAAPRREHLVDDVEAAGQAIHVPPLPAVHTESYRGLPGSCDLRGHVELERRQVANVLAEEAAVDPHLRRAVDSAEAEENALARRPIRQTDFAFVPRFAFVMVPELVAFGPVTLRLPRARNPDRVGETHRLFEPSLASACVAGVETKTPLPIQGHHGSFAPSRAGKAQHGHGHHDRWPRSESDNHTDLGKPPTLPEDSRSLTVPRIVLRGLKGKARFPLTLTLSPRERGSVMQSRNNVLRTTIVPAPNPDLPLPEGEGWGEGEGRAKVVPRVRTKPSGFEPFINSSLRISGRSETV
jgi:hypothetical protein